MKHVNIAVFMLILFISLGAASASQIDSLSNETQNSLKTLPEEIASDNLKYTFTDLQININNSSDVLDISEDYAFDNKSDLKTGIVIEKNNFTINGNNHILNGNAQSRIFNITGKNITINNLVFINANTSESGGAIYTTGHITLNNVTFIANSAQNFGGAIAGYEKSIVNCFNSGFIDNYAMGGSAIYSYKGKANVRSSYASSKTPAKYGQIMARDCALELDNLTFANIFASYCPAVYMVSSNASITNSRFVNLAANISAGAIAIKSAKNIYICNCEFINTTSSKNAGSINADIYGVSGNLGNVTIVDCLFKDTSSSFGGAYIQLGGGLSMNNNTFINNNAAFNGGSLYLSFVDAKISNCTFDSNSVEIFEGYPTYGGAIYADTCNLSLTNSKLTNNTAYLGNGLYCYDSNYVIANSTFNNTGNDIYTHFDKNLSVLDNNSYANNDSCSLNNTFYFSCIEGEAMELKLLNNTIAVDALPSKFDLRDWGWVSSLKNQGMMGSCWTFGMTGALESALLKACGIATDFSENNMQNTMIKYSIYGIPEFEGGVNLMSMGYLTSWLGAFSQDADEYDEVGKISPLITTDNDIHVQDVILIPRDGNDTQLKWAILKYGSLDISYLGQSKFDEKSPWYNTNTSAQYCNQSLDPNHEVSIVGWDDDYPKENFALTPPGDGAWIVKNSWGADWGDGGYLYLSYYDQTFKISKNVVDYPAAIIFDNTLAYNKNYQHSFLWAGEIINASDFGYENFTLANRFEALGDDLIAAVGSYFNESGYSYKLEIYVNGELKLVQDGISPYCGYHTIKLDSYVPVKKGDIFMVAMTSKFMPYLQLAIIRGPVSENSSFIYNCTTDKWDNLYLRNNSVVTLKAYTLADDSKITSSADISVDYDSGKYFSVNVKTDDGHAVSGAEVVFNINGKTSTVKTDKNGIAKIKITEAPKKYTITTTYNEKSHKNIITVKQVLKASKVTLKKTDKKFSLKAKLKINGKLQKDKVIRFKFNGKTYKVKTNSKGIAQKTLNKKVIKKLKKGKTYSVKVTYLKDTIKTTVKVK